MPGSPSAPPSVPVAVWGSHVAAARRHRGLSQQTLAEACGVTQQTISKVERGVIHAHDTLKLRIAAALDRSPAELFPWPDPEVS